MTNLFRFIGILWIESMAALMAGRNPRKLFQRIRALFNIKPVEHKELKDLERCYVFLLMYMMASARHEISFRDVAHYIKMSDEELNGIIWIGKSNRLIADEDEITGALPHFSELRSIYVHQADQNEEVVRGIYRILEHIYFVTGYSPAWTFISLKGDDNFAYEVMEG